MYTKLDGKTALVTGAGSGLGKALSTMLTDAGCTVVCADCSAEKLEALSADMPSAIPMDIDVASAESIAEGWRRLDGLVDRVDILINNAGTDHTLPITELTVDQIDRVLDVNLRGPFLMAREAMSRWQSDGAGGHIINICSTASKRAWPNASAYHASKWGLLGLSHAMGTEAREHGIKVTAVVVGGMRTPFILDRFPDTPLENLQDPANVAQTVRGVLELPAETVVPEVMAIPMTETSWP